MSGTPIFTYHKLGEGSTGVRDPFLYVRPNEFRRQLETLRQAGFESGTLDNLGATPDRSTRQAFITFDDGSAGVLKHGLQPLADTHFHAIQFVVAGLIGGRNEWDVAKGEEPDRLMDATQLKEWLAAGHQVGSHSFTHPNLKRVSLTQAREEIFGSKKKLEDTLGIPVRHFCYPSGKWNEAVRDLVAEAGYLTACTVAFGVNTPATPRFELRRIVPLSGAEWFRKARHRLGQYLTGQRG